MLGYADDIDIIKENEQKTLEILTHLKEKAQQMGLVINQDKTEYMVISREGTTKNSGHMQIDNMTIKRTETYKYLGTIFNCSNIIREEIQARINSGNKIYYALQHLLKSNALSRNTKITIYKTLIRPIVLYGSETWSTTKRDNALLQTFENKVLRRIFGPIRDTQSGEWKRRSNKDIHDLFKSPLITGIMKANRLQWLGHIERMEDNRETKLASFIHSVACPLQNLAPITTFRKTSLSHARCPASDTSIWRSSATSCTYLLFGLPLPLFPGIYPSIIVLSKLSWRFK